jgi:hypothetical protein
MGCRAVPILQTTYTGLPQLLSNALHQEQLPDGKIIVKWVYGETGSRDSSVGIATGYGLHYREVGFSLLNVVQTGSGAHPTSYTMGNGDNFPGGYSGRGVKLTTHQLVSRSRKRASIHKLPYTPSWRSALLVKRGTNLSFFMGKLVLKQITQMSAALLP